MDARIKMRNRRKRLKASYDDISKKCGVSGAVLSIVENGGVTHPNLVEKIKIFYKLNDDEAEQLLPPNRRPHSKHYDPNKWVARKDLERRFIAKC